MRRIVVIFACLCLLAPLAWSQDAVKVDAKHYKVILENDQVRVLHIKYGAKEKSVMHGHPDALGVFLTDLHGQFTTPDGKKQTADGKAGQTQWYPAGKHLPENLGDKPFELVLVELKAKPGAEMAAPAGTKDPVKVAAADCKVEFENDAVRVLRWNSPAKAKSPMHGHPAMVSVSLSGGSTKFTMPDGKTTTVASKPGEATWSGPSTHASESLSDKPETLIQVELKTKAAAKAEPKAMPKAKAKAKSE